MQSKVQQVEGDLVLIFPTQLLVLATFFPSVFYLLLMLDIVIPFWALAISMARISVSMSGYSSRTPIYVSSMMVMSLPLEKELFELYFDINVDEKSVATIWNCSCCSNCSSTNCDSGALAASAFRAVKILRNFRKYVTFSPSAKQWARRQILLNWPPARCFCGCGWDEFSSCWRHCWKHVVSFSLNAVRRSLRVVFGTLLNSLLNVAIAVTKVFEFGSKLLAFLLHAILLFVLAILHLVLPHSPYRAPHSRARYSPSRALVRSRVC